MDYYVVTFKLGNYTMAAYSSLQNMKIRNIKLAPVPFSLKTECDLCIMVFDYNTLLKVVSEISSFPIDGVYGAERNNGIYSYTKLQL